MITSILYLNALSDVSFIKNKKNNFLYYIVIILAKESRYMRTNVVWLITYIHKSSAFYN